MRACRQGLQISKQSWLKLPGGRLSFIALFHYSKLGLTFCQKVWHNLIFVPPLLCCFTSKENHMLMANRWSLTKSRGPAGGVCGNRLAVAFEMGVGSLAGCLLISPHFLH